MCLIEIPGYTICWILMNKLGRRWSFTGSLLFCSFTCVAAAFVPDGNHSHDRRWMRTKITDLSWASAKYSKLSTFFNRYKLGCDYTLPAREIGYHFIVCHCLCLHCRIVSDYYAKCRCGGLFDCRTTRSTRRTLCAVIGLEIKNTQK